MSTPEVDPDNPSGALPGDPRHGLNEKQLEEYYSAKSPSWLVRLVFGDGGREAADRVRIEHGEYLRAGGDRVRFGGPTPADDETTRAGSIWLIDATDRAEAENWVAAEPYNEVGAFETVDLTRWSSSMDLRQGQYDRTPGWEQFAITAIDGPDGKERRDLVAGAHHEYQASVMDRYVARGPLLTDDGSGLIGSFMIVEFPDRSAAEEFWQGEPLNTGGVFSNVTIDPWRYGSALG